MKKRIVKYCCLVNCLLVLACSSYAQRTADVITQQLDTYRSQNLQEKLFVHTDKVFYMAGEILWYKIYATDAFLQQPLDLSKVTYVELLNLDHKPILQAKIAMNNAAGNGSFQLPYSINSGNYTLRAYTNWMKNAGPDFFFEKNITVVNTLKKTILPVALPNNYDIQFFPEGGNLVAGITSKVAFRIVDANGKSQEAKGIVLNQRNDTVARFHTTHSGMGHFDFKPYEGDQYKAMITLQQGNTIAQSLPAAFAKGTVMQLKEQGKELLTVHIESTNPGPVTLLIHTRQLLKKIITQDLTNGETDIIIDKKEPGEGVSHFTLFTENKQPVCERLYFKKPEALSVNVQADAQQYGQRHPVSLTINTRNTAQQPLPGDLSASVFLLDSLQAPESADILSYLWLQSDLKGNIESPAYYFTNAPGVEEAADDLMLVQGWRRFTWQNILQPQKNPMQFLPETEGHIIQGRLVDKRNEQPVPNILTFLSVPRDKSLFNNATSSADGSVRFNIKNFYGGNEIVIQTGNASDSMYRLDITTPFSEKYTETRSTPLVLYQNQAGLLLSHSMEVQVGNTYAGDKQRRFLFPHAIDTTPFYGASAKQYYLDDYTRFITMEEVLREFVSEIRVRKNSTQFSFRLENKAFNNFFETSPLVLIDGVPVSNVNKVMEFDPLKVRKIDVVPQRFYQHQMVHDGIIQFHTYQGDLAGYQLDPNALIVEYEGLQLQREFYSPVYETAAQQQSRLPDPRNVLYWSPDVRTDKTGNKTISFYTADTPGRYLVFVQGIAANGLAGSATTVITVNP